MVSKDVYKSFCKKYVDKTFIKWMGVATCFFVNILAYCADLSDLFLVLFISLGATNVARS